MPTYWFFFSYARDREGTRNHGGPAGSPRSYQEQFFDDLVAEIHRRYGYPPDGETVGFVDVDIPTGQTWRDRLGDALNICRCFVFLQEPNYFQREWCGKEWHLFRSRIEAHLKDQPGGTPRPPLMIPILWVPTVVDLPHLAGEIQYKHRALGADYERVGVLDLIRLSKYRDDYLEFLGRLADVIYEAIRDHAVPPLGSVPSFDDVHNAFRPPLARATTPAPRPVVRPTPVATEPKKGPGCAQFVYVVASRDEIENENVRRNLDAYGTEPDDWIPYYPTANEPAYYLAQTAATNRRLKYEKLAFGPDLTDRLVEARNARKIVVLVVDSWSLKLDQYKDAMADYVDRNFWNSVVVVPWNEDEETRDNTEELQDLLGRTFYGLSEDAKRLRVVPSDRFLQELDAALNDRLGAILKAPGMTFRKVLGNGPRLKPALSAVRAG
jgi:FxsC-like protein